MVIYNSAFEFINSGKDIKDKIIKIDAIIAALLETALTAAVDDNLTEYSLDDGQTKIRSVYKGADAVLRSIDAFEKIRNRYVVQYNRMCTGSIFRLVDSKNITRNIYGRL